MELNTTEKKLSAIVFHDPCDPLTGKAAMKYTHVNNCLHVGVRSFVSFARRFPNAVYINFYNKKTGQYLGRIYLK